MKWKTYFVFYGICIGFLTGFQTGVLAQTTYHYDFNNNCQKAYHEIINLRLFSGRHLLENEKKIHPQNLIPYFLDNYIDFFSLFFNEDPDEFRRRSHLVDQRIEMMKKGDEASPYYLFTRSVIYFQWAAVYIKFNDKWDAGWSFRKSFLASRENRQKFPDFQPARMLLGSMQVAAGTIPPGYQWLSNLLGIRGSIADGMKNLEGMLESKSNDAVLFHDEAMFYFLYLKFYIQNQRDEVFKIIRDQDWDTRNNHLYAYLVANLSLNNQNASRTEEIIKHLKQDSSYLDMSVWDMQMGYAKADRLDTGSVFYHERFLNRFKGKLYKKDVLQKISWIYYLNDQPQKASAARSRLLITGSSDIDADKQAMKEAESGKWPNKILLKARLLDDGGYYDRALELFNGLSIHSFSDPTEQLEFEYRIGRIYDALGRKTEAVSAYQQAIQMGENRKEYYGARAALQTGYIYEELGNKKNALEYFQKVLDMKAHDYKNALDQKAKAGIERCGGSQ